MRIVDWLKSLFSSRAKFIAMYRNGMSKAKNGDFAGAVLDYTSAIDASGISNEVLGMALYNRALAYSAIHESDKAAEDLTRAQQRDRSSNRRVGKRPATHTIRPIARLLRVL